YRETAVVATGVAIDPGTGTGSSVLRTALASQPRAPDGSLRSGSSVSSGRPARPASGVPASATVGRVCLGWRVALGTGSIPRPRPAAPFPRRSPTMRRALSWMEGLAVLLYGSPETLAQRSAAKKPTDAKRAGPRPSEPVGVWKGQDGSDRVG